MKADISIVIALVIVFVLTMTVLFFVSTHNAIFESTFYGYRNPIWLRLDRDLRQLAYNALKEASCSEDKTVAYIIVRNWANIFNTNLNGMLATINDVSITLSNETLTNGSSYAYFILNITVYDLSRNYVTYYILVNASVTNFSLISFSQSPREEYNYSLVAKIQIKQYTYYDIVEVLNTSPSSVVVKNITYNGSGVNIITTSEPISTVELDVGGVKIIAVPRQQSIG